MNNNDKIKQSEQLIKELYIDLRRNVNKWSKITNQTPQARMGYVGQHLVSIVTGYPGGKSGARGYDLIIDGKSQPVKYGEIKTCYRVDQLGKCLNCNNVVSSLEKKCAYCGSENIRRNDDSKWLITIQSDKHLLTTFEPEYYYFVLFEFEDINNPQNNNIVATIWRVNTKNPGFYLCMLDYYYNIRAKSSSKAPFNMWPHMIKFQLTKPVKIYESIIYENDTMETKILDNSIDLKEDKLEPIYNFVGSKTLDEKSIDSIDKILSLKTLYPFDKRLQLKEIEEKQEKMSNSDFVDAVSYGIYFRKIKKYLPEMPKEINDEIKRIQEQIL